MKPLIDPAFWSDPEIESASASSKLAALWLITNSQTSILGLCNTSPHRFSFETGLPKEALDDVLQALPRAFKRFGNTFYVRNYVRYQFGAGEKLSKNNFFIALKALLVSVRDAELKRAIIEDYPEFEMPSPKFIKADRDHEVSPGLRMQVLARDEFVCLYTGQVLDESDLAPDHIIPRAKGGKTIPENLMAASIEMNNLKKDKDLEIFCKEQGFDFLRVQTTIKTRASKPLLGLSKPKDREGKESTGQKGSEEGKQKRQRKNVSTEIPKALDTPEFREQWEMWAKYRTERGKTLTETTIVLQLKKLEEMGERDAVASIIQSVEKGWEGLFDPDKKNVRSEPKELKSSIVFAPDAFRTPQEILAETKAAELAEEEAIRARMGAV